MSNKKKKRQQKKQKQQKQMWLWLIGLAVAVVTIVCVILLNKNPEDEEPVFSKYNEDLYLIDQWSEDNADGEKDYYVSFYLESKDYYDVINPEDVVWLDNGYSPITEVYETAEIQTFERFPGATTGVASYILIKTDDLLDLNKIYVQTSGPEEKIEGVETKEDYIEKTGSEEGWNETTVAWTEKNILAEETDEMSMMYNHGFLHMEDENSSIAYFETKEDSVMIAEDRKTVDVRLTKLSENVFDAFEETMGMTTLGFVDKETDRVDVHANWVMNTEIIKEETEDGFTIGYKYEDIESVKDDDGRLPNAIIILLEDVNYVIMFE